MGSADSQFHYVTNSSIVSRAIVLRGLDGHLHSLRSVLYAQGFLVMFVTPHRSMIEVPD